MQYNNEGYINHEKPLLMFHNMTQEEHLKRIEDALMEQRRLIRSSKAAAAELIDSLGIRHLLVPMNEEEIKAAEEVMAKWAEE